ncbi:MAG: class I SAM-dependent methyltransferase [Candidatus Promineifilaceae bacterium]
MSFSENPNIYDEIPYPDMTHSHTHTERMETLATMLGMKPAPVDNCRVLEIGCATGANLLPMAYAYPKSHFVGLDYASVQIEQGKANVSDLDLDNLELRHADIMDMPQELGHFDYIIAHGFYSWVPVPVRDQLLQICKRHLAPQGVVYISYNTYPGAYMITLVRGLMRYHIRDVDNPVIAAAKAVELIEFLVEALEPHNTSYSAYLASYYDLLNEKMMESKAWVDSLLVHDELAEINDPVYFNEFVEHASSFGMQYLVESELAEVMPGKLPPKVLKQLGKMARDTIEMEQYLDILKNRGFRRTLLCHQEIKVNRTLKPDIVFDLNLVSSAQTVEIKSGDLPENVCHFKGENEAIFSTDHPLTIAAFNQLNKIYPQAASFRELVHTSLRASPIQESESLDDHATLMAANFLRAYGYSESLVTFHVHPPQLAPTISEKPVASLIARWQSDHMLRVTNMRHERVEIDDLARRLIRRLDGDHDGQQLWEGIYEDYIAGKITLDVGETAEPGSEKAREALAKVINKRLNFFARAALLVA